MREQKRNQESQQEDLQEGRQVDWKEKRKNGRRIREKNSRRTGRLEALRFPARPERRPVAPNTVIAEIGGYP